jgi:dephospho-CoA kinase
MLRLGKIAVTGGNASGKSTVLGIFRKFAEFIVAVRRIVLEFLAARKLLFVGSPVRF